jgi:cytochrome oxidase Cu insertion factor (SCO1/SenC/PrrC family)
MPEVKKMTCEAEAGRVWKARSTLLLVVALFLAPILIATYLHISGWRPEGRSLQHGDLLQPARPIADTELQMSDGTSFRLSTLRGRWVMVYFGRLPCNEICRNNLYKMQQVRLAQGRDATRVQRLFVQLGAAEAGALGKIASDYQGIMAVHGTDAAIRKLADEFAVSQGTPLDGIDRVYFVDPHGNLVMSYAPDADPSGMRKDLAQLLKYSQIG